MANPQLKLISNHTPQPLASNDPIRRIFDHWVYLTERSVMRTKLGPTRRQAIAAALTLYTEDELMLAVEGNTVDAWCVENDRHEIDWLLVGEGRIERFIQQGEQLRLMAEREQRPAPEPAAPQATPEEAEAARARLKQMIETWKRQRGLRA